MGAGACNVCEIARASFSIASLHLSSFDVVNLTHIVIGALSLTLFLSRGEQQKSKAVSIFVLCSLNTLIP